MKLFRVLLFAALILLSGLSFSGCSEKAEDSGNTEGSWVCESLDTAEATVRNALENLAETDEIDSCIILSAEYDEYLTEINLQALIGSDLAKKNGFTDKYLESHFAVVSAAYRLTYSSELRMNENGVYKCIFHMTQDEATGLWSIWDYITPYLVND